MKSRPILFSAPMVRAILDGRKTQTRRIVKPRYIKQDNFGRDLVPAFPEVASPYGQPGDQLWVREAFAYSVIDPDGLSVEDDHENYDIIYRATDKSAGWTDGNGVEIKAPWKPSIHMPRWASRITLEIVSVRVERLQDISYADALDEGVSDFRTLIEPECQQGETADECARRLCWPQRSYRQLWEQINGAGSWEANPWVWAIEFKRIGE